MDQKKQTTPEKRYRTLVNSILYTTGDGILTFDAEGRIEMVNPAALKVFGYAADEMIGQSLTQLLVTEEQKTYADFWVSSPKTRRTHRTRAFFPKLRQQQYWYLNKPDAL